MSGRYLRRLEEVTGLLELESKKTVNHHVGVEI